LLIEKEEEAMDGRQRVVGRVGLVPLLTSLGLVFALPVMSAAVEVGEKAPDFELPSTMGGKIRLRDFVGKKNVVLEFYVLDFSPV
jgi:peroxiredoxin Q/BCP